MLATTPIELLRLENPHGTFWGSELPRLSRVTTDARAVSRDRVPLLFIHGMEYRGTAEVMRDLVRPFELEARLSRDRRAERFDYYFAAWDSRLLPPAAAPAGNSAPPILDRLFGSTWRWDLRLSCLEARARAAAHELQVLVRPLFAGAAPAPVVVSHSLGSYVWCETLRALIASGLTRFSPGIWWNLQPAVAADAFAPGGAYDFAPDLFSHRSARMELWRSRLDIVLATVFFIAKGRPAMGQVGAKMANRDGFGIDLDLTDSIREAHGQTFLWRRGGPFFRRVGAHVFRRAGDL